MERGAATADGGARPRTHAEGLEPRERTKDQMGRKERRRSQAQWGKLRHPQARETGMSPRHRRHAIGSAVSLGSGPLAPGCFCGAGARKNGADRSQ